MIHQSLNYIYMKRFLSWTFVVLSLCAGFASCSDDDDEVIPELIVNTPTLAVAGTGGAFEVPILTSGLAQDETVVITTDVDWVSNLQATNENFSFEVSKAPLDKESRTATFNLSLSKHPSIKTTCTLTQGKNHENFYIQMDELRGNSAIYTVIPASSQSESKFISYCLSSDELAQYKSATEVKDAIWAKQEAKADELVEKYDKYISETLSFRSRSGDKNTQELVRDLEPGKEYTIVVFGYSGIDYETADMMEVTTDLVKYTFVTPDNVTEITPTTLDVKVNVRGALYDVDITAGNSEAYIYPYNSSKSSYDKYYPGDESFIISSMFYYYSGFSYQSILRNLYKSHYEETCSSIKNNTESVACAVAFDSHLNLLCQPTKTTFTVKEPIPSDNILTISPDLKSRGAVIKVSGSNNDPFRVYLTGKKNMEALISDVDTEEEKETLLANYILQSGSSGQIEHTYEYGLWPNYDYVILAVGIAGYGIEERATTKVFKCEFTTPEATISTATCDFDIVKCFNSKEFGEAFDWFGWDGYRTTAFTITQSEDAEQIYYEADYLNYFREKEKEFEADGNSDRFTDWQYMRLEVGYEFIKMGATISEEDKDLIIYAAAKDKDGNFGPIAYFTLECDKMPISPISEASEFNPNNHGADTKSILVPLRANEYKPLQPEKQPARRTMSEMTWKLIK